VGFLLEAPDGLPFPTNYSLIFVISAITMGLGMGAWCLLKEPPDESVTPHHIHWKEQFKRGVRIFRGNKHYRIYVAARICIILGQVAMPFYIVYAKDVLGITARMISVYLTARTAASIFSNIFWGRIGDLHGNRRLIRITTGIAILVPLSALGIGWIGRAMPDTLPWLSYAFAIVFVGLGAFGNGAGIASINYLLDIAPPAQKPLYLGFTNTLMGIGMFTTALGGLIVDWAGFDAVMIIAAGFYVVAIGLSLFMIEPRKTMASTGG
jgi:predicted MFS family arabinose efflux permease